MFKTIVSYIREVQRASVSLADRPVGLPSCPDPPRRASRGALGYPDPAVVCPGFGFDTLKHLKAVDLLQSLWLQSGFGDDSIFTSIILRRPGIPGHALHEKALEKQKSGRTLVSIQER